MHGYENNLHVMEAEAFNSYSKQTNNVTVCFSSCCLLSVSPFIIITKINILTNPNAAVSLLTVRAKHFHRSFHYTENVFVLHVCTINY